MALIQKSFLTLFLVLAVVHGKTVRYRFEVSYISGSPDGVWVNHVLGINGKFPGPLIEAEVGDILQIDVINKIQDGQNVTLHWHGILQKGTPFEDGPAAVTQCPIKYGSHQVYTFPVPDAGTFWYHSHVNSQYTEGLWGVMIVRNPRSRDPYRGSYDKEILITLNDWYHTSGHENEAWLISEKSGGAPPYPSSALMNGVGRFPCPVARKQNNLCSVNAQKRPVFRVQRGKTYRIRLVNTAGWTAFNFTVDGHILKSIEVDGVDTVISSNTTQAVHIAAGQRYSFLLTTLPNATLGSQFLIRASLRKEFLFRGNNGNINPDPDALIGEVTGVLQYSIIGDYWGASSELVEPTFQTYDYTRTYTPEPWENLRFLKEATLAPLDGVPSPTGFDQNVELTIVFKDDHQGIRRGSFNGRPIDYSPNKRPQLADFIEGIPLPEGNFPVSVKYGDLVQIVVNNPAEGPHPIHLHGHHFWVMGTGQEGDGNYDPARHQLNYNGMRRDTAVLKERSWLVIKFRADNVGIWSLHCHVDWHMLTGMMMTIVEAPELASQLKVPSEARRVCAEHGIKI